MYTFTKKELSKLGFRKVQFTDFKKKDGSFSWNLTLIDSNIISHLSYGIDDWGPMGMVGVTYNTPREIKSTEKLLTICNNLKQRFINTVNNEGNCWSRWISTEELLILTKKLN